MTQLHPSPKPDTQAPINTASTHVASRNVMSSPVRSTSVSSKVSPWLTAILYPLARYLVLPLYFRRLQIRGQQNLPQSGAIILAPTHRSRWDPILVAHSAGYPVTGKHPHFMTSANETEGLQGLLVRRLGAFPVDLSRAGIGSLRHGLELLLKQQMLVIFPEGNVFFIKRNREKSQPDPEQVYPIKPGLGRLAIQAARCDRPSALASAPAGLHVVPISLRYSSGIPSFRCDVFIDIGEAIAVQPYLEQGSSKQAAKALMARVKSALVELHQHRSR